SMRPDYPPAAEPAPRMGRERSLRSGPEECDGRLPLEKTCLVEKPKVASILIVFANYRINDRGQRPLPAPHSRRFRKHYPAYSRKVTTRRSYAKSTAKWRATRA